MCRSTSYRSRLCKIWLQKPGQRGDSLFESCAWPIGSVLLQANSYETFQNEILPSFRTVRRLLQTKGPSGSRLNSSTVPIRFWVLSTVQRLMLFTAMDGREKPPTAMGAHLLGLNTLCIFQGLRLCQFWMVQVGWVSLQVETRNSVAPSPEQAEISTLKIKLGDLPRWPRSRLKQRCKASWKLALHSSVQCEPSKLSFGTLGMEGGKKQRNGDFETPVFREASWSSHPIWTKSWLWKAAFSNALIRKTMLQLLCQFWMVQAGWASLQVETRNFVAPRTSWNLHTQNQAWRSATLTQKPPQT